MLALHKLISPTKIKSYIFPQDQACCRHQGKLASGIYRKRSAKEKKTEENKVLACKHRSNQKYYDEFNSMVLTATESGATIGAHPGAINEVLNTTAADTTNPAATERDDATKIATSRYLAVAFLLGADKIRYGTLVEDIENEYLRNKGSSSTAGTYPTSIAESYDYLCNYKRDPKNLTRLLGQNPGGHNLNTGVAFAQDGARDGDNIVSREQTLTTHGGTSNRKKVCRRCGTNGHTSIKCNVGQDKVEIYRQSQQANQGVSQLIHSGDWDGVSGGTDDEAQNWAFLTQDTFKSDGPIQCTTRTAQSASTRARYSHKPTVAFPTPGTSWTTSLHVTSCLIPSW
jgi:hypothetical protein